VTKSARSSFPDLQHHRTGTLSAVEVPATVYEAMIRHSLSAAPLEACGLVAAGPDGRAVMTYCLANLDVSPVSYTLDPSEHIRALHHAEKRSNPSGCTSLSDWRISGGRRCAVSGSWTVW